jgi:hypothetical protein
MGIAHAPEHERANVLVQVQAESALIAVIRRPRPDALSRLFGEQRENGIWQVALGGP